VDAPSRNNRVQPEPLGAEASRETLLYDTSRTNNSLVLPPLTGRRAFDSNFEVIKEEL